MKTARIIIFSITRIMLLVLVASLFIGRSSVSADFNSLPGQLSINSDYDQYVSTQFPDGSKGNYTPWLTFLFYTKNTTPNNTDDSLTPSNNVHPQETTVDLTKGPDTAAPTCSDIDSAYPQQYQVRDNNKSGNASLQSSGRNINCSPASGHARITLNRLYFVCSDRFNANQSTPCPYLVTMVRIQASSNNSFFTDISAPGSAGLSYVGTNSSTVTDGNSSGVSLSLNTNANTDKDGYGSITVNFAAPCDYDGGKGSGWLHWKDADSNANANGNEPVTVKLQRKGSNGSWTNVFSQDAGHIPNHISDKQFTPTAGTKYRVIFDNVLSRKSGQASNTIKIWYPFDSAAYNVDCPDNPPPVPTCTGFDKDITDNSYWRYSIFSTNSPPAFNTPYPSGEGGHTFAAADPSAGQWATFSQPPTQVVKHTPTHDYTDHQDFPTPSASGWYVFTEHWFHESNGNWQYFYDDLPFVANCYSANCSIDIDGNLPDGSNNVMAGSDFDAIITVNNTGKQRLYIPGAGGYINGGSSGAYSIDTPPAPTTRGTYQVGGLVTANPYNPSYNVASCPANYYVYQHYHVDATVTTPADDEDPVTITYGVGGQYKYPDSSYPYAYAGPISSTGSSYLQYRPVIGASVNVDPHTNSNSYGNPPDTNYTYANPYTPRAGDKFCPVMTINDGDGWIGGGGDHIFTSPTTSNGGCMDVVNKPYFKVYGSGACAGSGELASWNNNSGQYPFGAGAQMAALATGKITGFASGQPAGANGGSRLSFSNTVNVNGTDDYSPNLGGNFGSSDCATDIEAPDGVIPAAGNKTINTTNVDTGQNIAVFVNGDVYIGGNITYTSSTPWTEDTVPSYVLKATGNIYIGANVKNLDGVYSSDKKIYTCGNPDYTPVTKNNLYACNNQLVVHGSFTAKQVNLMRTFGSLRDEKPSTATTPTDNTYSTPSQFCFGENDTGKNNCVSAGYSNCVLTYEGARPSNYNAAWANYPYDGVGSWWLDDYLCVKPASNIKLAWTDGVNWYYDSGNSSRVKGTSCAYWSSHGGSGYDATGANGVWSDNQLCVAGNGNKKIYFSASDVSKQMTTNSTFSTKCIVKMFDAADAITGGSSRGAWLCEDQDITASGNDGSPSPHVNGTCNNPGTVAFGRVPTCAAEIFDFSPQLYLSKPGIQKPSNGALQFDAITSLPPVL